MAGLTRSNLLKVKRFKESKADFEQQVGRASWFYLAWAILMLGALLMEGSILSGDTGCRGAGSPRSNHKTQSR